MMSTLWVYTEGSLDAAEKALTLLVGGPDFETKGKTAKYRDVIEFKSDDHRTPTSYVQGNDGAWNHLMTSHYRRNK